MTTQMTEAKSGLVDVPGQLAVTAAHNLVGLFVSALGVDRVRLSQACATVRAALLAGASGLDVVDAVVRLTAPPADVARPWERFLPMSLEEFERTGKALLLWDPAGQVALWLCADEFAVKRVRDRVSTLRQIRRPDWAKAELARADVPEAEQTVGKLAAVLGAKIAEVR